MTVRSWVLALVVAVLASAPAVARADGTPVYYNVPSGHVAGAGIVTAPNGDVWFAAGDPGSSVAEVGRLVPALASAGTSNGFSIYPTPTPAGGGCCVRIVRSVGFDPTKSTLWFVQSNAIVGSGVPANMVAGASDGMNAVRLPGGQDLWDVFPGKDGGAWFTESSTTNVADGNGDYPGDRIAFAGDGLGITEYDNFAVQGPAGDNGLDSTRYDSEPEGITVDANGAPWYTEADAGLPGYRIGTVGSGGGHGGNGAYSEYLVQPCQMSPSCSGESSGRDAITDIAAAPDGSEWFTNALKNQIGRFDGSGFTSYNLTDIDAGLANGKVRAITMAPDGTLWVADFGFISHPTANAIIRIDPSNPAAPTATVYHLGSGHAPYAVAADSSGNVWFSVTSDSSAGYIGELPGVVSTTGGGGGGGGGGGTTTTDTTPAPAPGPSPAPGPPPGPAPVVLKPATVAPAHVDPPHVDHGNVLATQVCVAYDGHGNCAVVYLIATGEYVDAFPGAKTSKAKTVKPVILARKKVTTKQGTKTKVKITLSKKGKKLLKKAGKLKVYFTAEQAAADGKPAKILRKTTLTLKP